jgi:cell filamentation protein
LLGDDKYTYPGSGGVLRNRLNIRDRAELEGAINDYASVAWAALALEEPDMFDFDYLMSVHRRLFGRVLAWAGQIRDVDVMAAGTSITYCRPHDIEPSAAELFDSLQASDYLRGLDTWDFARALARAWTGLAYIHPFRDGNTRSQVVFFSRLAVAAGHPIDWAAVNVDALRQLRVSALNGFPQNMADYVYDRLLDPADLFPDNDVSALSPDRNHESGT